jgi:hypothetical protein
MLGRLDEISFGNIKIWNFQKKAAEYIPDEVLRNKIKALLDTNKYGGKTIEDMGILSIGDIDFRHATEADIQLANQARLTLFLSFLAHSNVSLGPNAGLNMVTSENFAFVVQNFVLDSDYMSESAGYIVNRSVGGYKVHEITFVAPPHVLKPLNVLFDTDLLATLQRVQGEDPGLYRRILRAADLFFESYYNNPHLSLNARILLEISSLEVLLNLPSDNQQRRQLKDAIKRMVVLPNDPVERYLYETRSGSREETRSIKVKWADRFYTLRNHIIHGDEVSLSDFLFESQRHMDIATMFFILLTKKLLNERFGEKIFYDRITWDRFMDGNGDQKEGFIYHNGGFEKYFATLKQN